VPGQLTLLDAPSLWYRAFHGVPETVTAPDGAPVNAVRGTVDLVARIVRDTRPARLVACLDLDWRPAFRVAAVPSYKAHRLAENGAEAEPPSLAPQVAVLLEVFEAVGLAVAGARARGRRRARHAERPGDRRGRRRVRGPRHVPAGRDDGPVRVLYAVEKLKPYGEREVAAKYGIPAPATRSTPCCAATRATACPGVKGVGDKTAAALVTRFGRSRGSSPRSTPGSRTASRPAPGQAEAAATTCGRAGGDPHRCATCRSRSSTTRSPAPRDPERLVALSTAGAGQPLDAAAAGGRTLRAVPAPRRRGRRARWLTDDDHAEFSVPTRARLAAAPRRARIVLVVGMGATGGGGLGRGEPRTAGGSRRPRRPGERHELQEQQARARGPALTSRTTSSGCARGRHRAQLLLRLAPTWCRPDGLPLPGVAGHREAAGCSGSG
jgi:hypothetical protein